MRKGFSLLGLAVIMACNAAPAPPITPDPTPNVVTQDVKASLGGDIQLEDGVRLQIPAGALSSDTKVTVETIPAPQDNTDPALVWADNAISVDLGDANTEADLEVSFPIPDAWNSDLETAQANLRTKSTCWIKLDLEAPIVFATKDEQGHLWLQRDCFGYQTCAEKVPFSTNQTAPADWDHHHSSAKTHTRTDCLSTNSNT